MKVSDALAMATDRTGDRTEAEVLLGHLLDQDRVGVYLRGQQLLDSLQIRRLGSMVKQRVAGFPLQYVTGVQSFRGLDVEVGPGVLVPRPETEQVVESALELIAEIEAPIIFDVCTGSGAMALSLVAERPDAVVFASDISADALSFAYRNGAGSKVDFRCGDLFDAFSTDLLNRVDLVISNPPYLS
ncbi:MAG: HemK/PrmC family methyltransferase, partial [Actinomycetota bacterium]